MKKTISAVVAVVLLLWLVSLSNVIGTDKIIIRYDAAIGFTGGRGWTYMEGYYKWSSDGKWLYSKDNKEYSDSTTLKYLDFKEGVQKLVDTSDAGTYSNNDNIKYSTDGGTGWSEWESYKKGDVRLANFLQPTYQAASESINEKSDIQTQVAPEAVIVKTTTLISEADFKKSNHDSGLTDEQLSAAYKNVYIPGLTTTEGATAKSPTYDVKEVKDNANKVIGYMIVGGDTTVYATQIAAKERSTILNAEAKKTENINTFTAGHVGASDAGYVSSDGVTPVMKTTDGNYWQYDGSNWNPVANDGTVIKVTKYGTATTVTENYKFNDKDKSFTAGSVVIMTWEGSSMVMATMTPGVYSSLGVNTAAGDIVTATGTDTLSVINKDGTNLRTATITHGGQTDEKSTVTFMASDGTTPIRRVTTDNSNANSHISITEIFETRYYDAQGNSISVDDYNKLKTQKEKDKYPDKKTTHTSHTGTITDVAGKEIGKINYDYSYYTEDGVETAAMISYTKYADIYADTSNLIFSGAPGTQYFYVSGANLNNIDLNGVVDTTGRVSTIPSGVAVVTFENGKATDCKGNCGDDKKKAEIMAEADTAQNQRAVRDFFGRLDFALTKFSGLSGFSSLIWGDDQLNEWRENVDKLFASAYLGTEYWTSEICKSSIESVPSNVAMVETAPGVFQAAATVSAERSPAVPFENATINITQNAFQYLYKISAYVKAVEDDTKFNIYVSSSNFNKPIFNETKSLNEGESFSLTGDAIITKYSFSYYDTICIVFESGDISNTCNAIPESSGVVLTGAETGTTTTGGTTTSWEDW
ncbi:hypothetical protein HYU07_00635 [Candidatus Woesearchaeota archaeon]|nr:hypothetical protein [Candidatus Woesearchaeota archaeon]